MIWRVRQFASALMLSAAMGLIPKCSQYKNEWDQSMKMVEEAEEVRQAIVRRESRWRINEEAVDVVCTAGQYLRRQPMGQRFESFLYVLEKNRKRGYW